MDIRWLYILSLTIWLSLWDSSLLVSPTQPLPSPTGLVHHRPAPPRADKQLRIYLQVRKLLAARYLRYVRQVVVYEGVTSVLFISQQVQVTRASARRHTTNVTPRRRRRPLFVYIHTNFAQDFFHLPVRCPSLLSTSTQYKKLFISFYDKIETS